MANTRSFEAVAANLYHPEQRDENIDQSSAEDPDFDELSAAFARALALIGEIAGDIDPVIEMNSASIAEISTRGDWIDRLLEGNRAAIAALLSDAH